jgi:hypothetical protein
MNVRFALLAALGGICFGCANVPEQQAATISAVKAKAATDAVPTRSRERASLTGTRLPPLDDDDQGTASVRAVSGDDYRQGNDTRQMPLHGEGSGGLERGAK